MPQPQRRGDPGIPGVSLHQCTPPSLHPGLIARPRVAALFDATDAGIVLVSAGAGFGKTTAIRQWVEDDGRRLAWITLGPHDNDPVVVVRALVCCVNQAVAVPDAVTAALQPTPAIADHVLPLLESALAEPPEPYLIVIDDLERVSDPTALGHLDRLLDRVAPGSRIVLASRSVPPIGTARRVVEGTLAEIGVYDLAFTGEEVETMLEASSPGLDPVVRREVAQRAEGWPAGVQLATLALARNPDAASVEHALSGDGHLLSEYFREEMLQGLDTDDVTFLLRTSILERLSGDMCDFVLERTGSAEHLDRLVSTAHTLVLPLEDSGTFRYHALFRDMLEAQACRTIPAELDHLRRRAIEWHRENGEGRAAVDLALAMGDGEAIADAMARELVSTVHRGEVATLERWLEGLPDREAHRDDLRLALCEGWLALLRGRRADVERWLDLAEAAEFDGPMPDGTASAEVAVAALRMVASLGGSKGILETARTILEAGPEGSRFWATASVLAGVCRYVIGLTPDIREAMEPAEFDSRGTPAPHAVALSHLALAAFREGDLDEGNRLIQQAVDEVRSESLGEHSLVAAVDCVRSYGLALRGDRERSLAASQHGLDLMAGTAGVTDRGQGHLRLVLAEAALARGDDRAASLLHTAEEYLDRDPDAVVLHDWADDLRHRIAARSDHRLIVDLTPAELGVLEQLPSHLSLAEIGDRLYVSRNTVKSHTLSVYRKLGVAGRSQAVEQAQQQGLLDGTPRRPPRSSGGNPG